MILQTVTNLQYINMGHISGTIATTDVKVDLGIKTFSNIAELHAELFSIRAKESHNVKRIYHYDSPHEVKES